MMPDRKVRYNVLTVNENSYFEAPNPFIILAYYQKDSDGLNQRIKGSLRDFKHDAIEAYHPNNIDINYLSVNMFKRRGTHKIYSGSLKCETILIAELVND